MSRQVLTMLLIVVAALVIGWIAYSGGFWAGAR